MTKESLAKELQQRTSDLETVISVLTGKDLEAIIARNRDRQWQQAEQLKEIYLIESSGETDALNQNDIRVVSDNSDCVSAVSIRV